MHPPARAILNVATPMAISILVPPHVSAETWLRWQAVPGETPDDRSPAANHQCLYNQLSRAPVAVHAAMRISG